MKNKIKQWFKSKFGMLCSQKTLLDYKILTQTRISNTEKECINAIIAKDEKVLVENRKLLEDLRKDLTKIKNRIQLNNVLLNVPVYQREELQKLKEIEEKQLETYEELSYSLANDNLRKIIVNELPQKIVNKVRELKEIDKKRMKKNNLKLTLIRLKTI